MPNWAFGTVMLRGEVANVLKFLRESFEDTTVSEQENGLFQYTVRLGDNPGDDYPDHHIKGTNRCFSTVGEIDIERIGDGATVGAEFEVECAWDLDDNGFRELSEKYSIALAVYVEEAGAGFTHYFECENGEVLRDEVGDYNEEGEE